MGAEYKLRVKNTSGTLVAEVSDFWDLAYHKRVNEPGLLESTLSGDHDLVGIIADKYQVEVWRRLPEYGIDWYADFYGLFRDQERYYTDKKYFTARCPGQMSMLGWRYVMWYAGTLNRSEFWSDPAETIMKTLVSYNAGSSATTGNGRMRTGTITGLSEQADGTNGTSLPWFCAWKNLLAELQDLARVGGGDFDLIKTGGATWEFRWYTGQRGPDRSSTVMFSLERGNMANPRYRYNRMAEATAAVVAGQGQGAARKVTVTTGADYSASNDIEVYVDARNKLTSSGREKAGDKRLEERRARQEFTFDVLQTEASLYGQHYCVSGVIGDLVKARYDTVEVTQKITGVTVALDRDGNETIDIETETQ